MSMTVEQIATEALGLPSEVRTLLVEQIVESLEVNNSPGNLDTFWAAEARRRLAEIRSDHVKTMGDEESAPKVNIAAQVRPDTASARSFIQTACSLKLDGPPDWSEKLDEYLYGDKASL